MHGDRPIVAGEDLVHLVRIGFFGKKADERHERQVQEHHQRAEREGRIEEGGQREVAAERQVVDKIQDHHADAETKTEPHGSLRRLLPIQPVEEGREEGARERAPRNTHHLRDEAEVAVVLHDGDDGGNDDEHDDEDAHDEHFLPVRQRLIFAPCRGRDEVDGKTCRGRHRKRGERRHRSGEHEDDDEPDEEGRKFGDHRRDDRVIAARGERFGIEAGKAAEEVTPAGHDERKERGDERPLLDRLLILDGVELLHHLRKPPGAERR